MGGMLVETAKSGKGKTDSKEKPINGKIVVILDNSGKKVLCDPKTLKIYGYWD